MKKLMKGNKAIAEAAIQAGCRAFFGYSVQEACDFVQLAFEKAEKYRCPVFVLADAMIGQMMETVEIKTVPPKPYDTSWAARGWKDKSRPQAVIASIHTPQKLARVVQGLLDTYERMAREDVMYETVDLEGAEYVFVAFGTMARLCLSAMEKLRDKGIRAGLIRPQTLFPFPEKIIAQTAGLEGVKGVVVPELNAGQMVYDVKLAVNGVKPVYSHKNLGSIMPSPAQLCEYVASLKEKR